MAGDVSKASLYAIVKPNVSVSKLSLHTIAPQPVSVAKASMYAIVGETNNRVQRALVTSYSISLSLDFGVDWRVLRNFGKSLDIDYAINGKLAIPFEVDYAIGLAKELTFDYVIQDQPPEGVQEPGGAHDYWRVRYRSSDANNHQLSEIYFLDSANVDLCIGGSVIYSSQFNGTTFAAANAFDRNTATNYAALGNVGEWIGYHFPVPVEVDKIRVRASTSNAAENPEGYLVEYSDDGSTWSILSAFYDPAGNMASDADRTLDFTNENFYTAGDTSPHRYWRMRSLVNGQDGFNSAAEIDFLDGSGASLTDAHGGTPSASSEQGAYPVAQAFDGNPATLWYSAGINAEYQITWDFGAANAQTVEGFKLRADTATPERTAKAFAIEFSDDNVTWKVRYLEPGNLTWASGQERTFMFGAPPTVALYRDFTTAWKIVRAINADLSLDYRIIYDPIYSELTFDYEMASFSVDLVVDYRIALSREFGIDYSILLASDLTISYLVDGTFRVDLAFDYKVALNASLTFSYAIALSREITFDYVIGEVGAENLLYIARLPEIPVYETWRFVTKVSTSRNGKEQRAALRKRPRVELSHAYRIETDADFRHFQQSLLQQRAEDIYVAQHALAVSVAETGFGQTTIHCAMENTDIRVGEYVVFFNIGTEASALKIVTDIDTDAFTVEGGMPFEVGRGCVVMPVRKMRFADGSALNMAHVSGETRLAFEDATSRALIRPSALPGLVETLDGYPILTRRPLADDGVTDAYSAGFALIDMSPRLPPSIVRRWPVPAVSKGYSFNIERGESLDYWREFADTVRGSWKAFLMPTWRPDLVAIALAGSSLTVDGDKLTDAITNGAYKRLMVTTDSGTAFVSVTNAVADGSGNTVLTLSDSVAGSTVESVSFVNLVRLSDDAINFEHYELYSKLSLNMRVIQQ